MICVRKDLIDEELTRINKDRVYTKLKPSNRFIDWLFRHYYTIEFYIHYYDNAYDEENLTFNNWVDPYGEGIWGMSQRKVDQISRDTLYEVRSKPVKKDERLYIAYEDDYIFIYWYGRDFMDEDYWWVMKRR